MGQRMLLTACKDGKDMNFPFLKKIIIEIQFGREVCFLDILKDGHQEKA